jgi:type IV secretory pathway TraG/TraD family ATPase VirD4
MLRALCFDKLRELFSAIPLSIAMTACVSNNIKGELSARYRKLLESGQATRPFIRFAPMEEDGWCFDPFELPRQCGAEYLVQYIREIALSLIPLPPDVRDPFWTQAAQNFLMAALLYYYELGASFSEAMIGVQTTPPKTLVEEIVDSGNENALMFINQMLDLAPKTLAGIATEMSNKIMVFATDPFISEAFGIAKEDKKCFTWKNLDNHNIFLCIPEDKIEQWSGVIALMINQLFRVLERRPDKHSPQGASVPPALLLLDEFPRLGKLGIVNAVSTLRSKKVTIAIFVQSIAQLDLIYGEHARRVIADNCSYKALLGANDPETQKYMSELVGGHEVKKISYTMGLYPKDQIKAGHSVHVSTQYEPIMRPEEFGRLKEDIALVTPEGHCRVKKVPYYGEVAPKRQNPVWKIAKCIFKPAIRIAAVFGLLIAVGLSKE